MEKENEKIDWSKEAVLEMIALWQKHECLYNPKNQFYHNKHARYSALSEVADQLKVFNESIGPNDVKNKMQYLRGQYTRELCKCKDMKSGSGTDDLYVPNAYWYSEMSFLQDFVKIRKGNCNLNVQNSLQFEDSCESSQQPDNDEYPPQTTKKAKSDKQTPVSSRKTNKEDEVLEAAVDVLKNLASNKSAAPTDKNDVFCNFIKSELAEITNSSIRDEFLEAITLSLLDAKRKQRLLMEAVDASDFCIITD
ncbi:uncharacterized protein [Musca autumnalis]|uniref:uncharacterized protein n=1 Tax=Musca autumnalis TaxID=221902 RepID=UPI003CEAF808